MGYRENKDAVRIWRLSIRASTQENLPLEIANSDQHLCYSLIGKNRIKSKYKQNFNFLSSLCS